MLSTQGETFGYADQKVIVPEELGDWYDDETFKESDYSFDTDHWFHTDYDELHGSY